MQLKSNFKYSMYNFFQMLDISLKYLNRAIRNTVTFIFLALNMIIYVSISYLDQEDNRNKDKAKERQNLEESSTAEVNSDKEEISSKNSNQNQNPQKVLIQSEIIETRQIFIFEQIKCIADKKVAVTLSKNICQFFNDEESEKSEKSQNPQQAIKELKMGQEQNRLNTQKQNKEKHESHDKKGQEDKNVKDDQYAVEIQQSLQKISLDYLKSTVLNYKTSQQKINYRKQKKVQIQNIKKQLQLGQMIIKRCQDEAKKSLNITFNFESLSKKLGNQQNLVLLKRQQEIVLKSCFQIKQNQSKNQLLIQSQRLGVEQLEEALKEQHKNEQFYQVNFTQVKDQLGKVAVNLKIQFNMLKLQNQLQQFIDKLQKILGQRKVKSSQVYKKVLAKYRQNIKRLKQQFMTAKVQLEDLKSGKNKSSTVSKNIDVTIVMDITGSMSSHLQQAKNHSKEIIRKFKLDYKQSQIKYAFIGYRDHNKPYQKTLQINQNRVVESFDFNEAQIIENQISKTSASGGDDCPQAMFDGLNQVTKLKWRSQATKFVFLIYDAPPHGRQFYDGGDNFPDGCPCGIKLQTITEYFRQNNIYINLKQCGVATGKTKEVFEKAFPSHLFGVQNMKAQQFSAQISQNMRTRIKQLEQTVRLFAIEFSKITSVILEQIKLNVRQIVQQAQEFSILTEMKRQVQNFKKQILIQKQKCLNQTREKIAV